MNYPAASYGVSKTPRNEASFGEFNPERFNGSLSKTMKFFCINWDRRFNPPIPYGSVRYYIVIGVYPPPHEEVPGVIWKTNIFR